MVGVQHPRLPLSTINENIQQHHASQSSSSSPSSQKSALNPACQTFAPRHVPMEPLDPFYVLPTNSKAIFSTNNGKYEKRSLQNPLPMRVARSDFAKDVEAKFQILWDRFHFNLHDLKPLQKREELYQFFDAVDLYVEGIEFCFRVVGMLSDYSQHLGTQTHIDIDAIAKAWVQEEGSRLWMIPAEQDVTLYHQEFSQENLAHWDHEEDLALLRRAINHYMSEFRVEFHARQMEQQRINTQFQEQYPNRTNNHMYPQGYNQYAGAHAARQQSSQHSQQDSRQSSSQYGNDNKSFGHRERSNTSIYRDRSLSNASRGRGGHRNFSNQRHGNRMSPPREQSVYQRNFSDHSSGPSPYMSGPEQSYQRDVWQQSLSRQMENKGYGLGDDDLGEQFVVSYSNRGDPTLVYDGETKENKPQESQPLTVWVAGFHALPNYFENHELKRLLSACGQVVAVSYLANLPNPIAFVEFKHQLAAETAITRFNGHLLPNNIGLSVRAKRDAKTNRSRSGSGTSVGYGNNSFTMHRRDSIREEQPYPSYPGQAYQDSIREEQLYPPYLGQTHPNTMLPPPMLNNRVPFAEQIQHLPLGRIENLPSVLYGQQDARMNHRVENRVSPIKENSPTKTNSSNKENSPIKENSPNKENNAKKRNAKKSKKGSGQPTPAVSPVRSRSVVRLEKMQENQRPQSENSAIRDNMDQQKGLQVNTEDRTKENMDQTRPTHSSDPMTSVPPITGQPKKKSKPKKKKVAKSEGGHPESLNASEGSGAVSPVDHHSPEKTFTPNASFSTDSSKAPSFALSDRGRAPENIKTETYFEKCRSSQEIVLPGSNSVSGHAKKDSSGSAAGRNAAQRADEHKHKRGGSNQKATKHDEDKVGGDHASGSDVCGEKLDESSISQTNAVTSITNTPQPDARPKETASEAPSAKEQKVEPFKVDSNKVVHASEPVKLPSTPVPEGKPISMGSGRPTTPSTDKKKAIVKVAIPLSFSRTQQSDTLLIASDSLGSLAWPFVKSSRPI